MDPFISPIYEKAIDIAVLQVVKQAGYLLHYNDNFEDLQDKVNQLHGARQTIQHWIEEEERKHGNKRESYVQEWLDRVDNLNKEAKKLVEDPRRVGATCHKWLCPNLKLRRKLSKMAKEMAENVAKLEQVGNFVRVTFSSPTDYLESFYGALAFESRMPLMKDMIEALKDPKKRIIGVYGLGGVGKTTLARQVASKLKVDKVFNVVVEAKVGENPQMEKIQDDIADLLGMKLEEKSVIKRADRIRKGIEKEKSILIILDDVRTKIELEEVGIPDPSKMNLEDGGVSSATAYNVEKGKSASKADNVVCKILMTSRIEVTLREMGSERSFSIDLLNEKEAWSLFEVMAALEVNGRHSSLRQIAPQVAQKCGGLPVVISAMAKTLKNRSINDWKAALKKLKRAETKEMQEMIQSALELCYHWLESDEVKTLFLLCSVSTIRLVSDLIKYGIGLGIFKGAKTVEEARDNLYQMISSLKASCLFIDDENMEFVTMHDTVREVATKIASKNQYFFTKEDDPDLEEWPVDDLKKCPIITVIGNCIQKLPERLDCPKVEFFFLNHPKNRSLVIPPSFFEGMGNLKVLDLTGMIISSLPTSFSSLTKLKTLCLDQCDLKDLAGLGALKSLQVLSLLRSSMIQLPSEIAKLTRLRMLDLSNSIIEVIPPNVLSNLIKLEELYMENCSIKWEVENSTQQHRNASLAELRHLINLTALEIQIHDALMLPKNLNFEKLEKYKIFIGDIWDWSESNEVSTTILKLKLGFSIDLVHWVKALIKNVENLYLDEISDISNVLYQLNENDQLKHLHIQNNANIQHIVDSSKRKQAHFSFPNLETLELNNLGKLEKICHGPFMKNSFSKLKAIKVTSCDQLEYILLVSMVKALSQLLEIQVSNCNSMKKIVFMECEDDDITIDKIEFTPLKSLVLQNLPKLDDFCSNEFMSSVGEPKYRSLTTKIWISFFNAKLAFPNLETLKLSSINLNKIWDDHQLSTVAYSFRNLANLTVEDCGGLTYLFSSLMVDTLSNLKQLEISKCDMMEEIIATERRNNGIELVEVPFPKLEKITIKDMKNLKAVWHSQFEKLKIFEVISCDKIGNVFPSHMQGTFQSLETLTVSDCNSVEEIFELSANGENGTTQLKQLTLLRLPQLKRIWSKDQQRITSFHNLKFVCVEDCEVLEYLFPFSIAVSLHQVEEISLKQAFMMKEIVSTNEGPIYSPVQFKFENLTSLMLCNLPELKTFYAQNHSLTCPSLRELNVFNCKKMKFFKTQQRTSSRGQICDSKFDVSTLQTHFNNVEEVIENLEVWTLNSEDARAIFQCQLSRDQFEKLKVLRLSMFKNDQATFPYWFLQNTSNLEWLVVEWSSFREIFQYEKLIIENGNFEISAQIKFLRIYELHNLQYICKEGSEIDPLLKALEGIFVSKCSSITQLVPSSFPFNHLTYLEVEKCNGLVNLITSSTARTMAKLTVMRVTDCSSLEQIVTEERDDANRDIVFTNLEILELECLPRLNKFCSSECLLNFPLLEKVVVRQCPRMKMFSAGETSTPRLLKVLVEENGEEHWEGDLNRTIKKMSKDLVAFHSFKHMELSEYHELEELWYGQVGNKVFSNLKTLVVHNCGFLSQVLLTSTLLQALCNLEELDVRDCDSVEVVFDLIGINEQQTQVMENTIHLKKIIVSNLPILKHIWRCDSQEIASFEETREDDEADVQHQQPGTLHFHNLQAMQIEDCPVLEHLFPFSIAMDIPNLKELYIESCGMKEIVARKHGPIEKTPIFVFDYLTSLDLKHLYELTGFYARINTLKCRFLKRLNVFDCKKLKLFNIQPNRCGESSASDKLHFSMPQSFFSSEEVIGNLEELTLNYEDTNTILQGQLSWDLFSNLKLLRLSQIENDEANFPHLLVQNIPNLENLVVEFCSFKEIFYNERHIEDEEQTETSIQLKTFGLRYLHNLQHICKQGFQIDPTLKILEGLFVTQCSSLIHLVPSYVTFNHLSYLSVEDCEALVSLISSSTARSLVKLTTIKIANCNLLEQIVAEEEDEPNDEITFRNLETLELECLPNLKSFSSSKCLLRFPLLERVLVKQCLSMTMFSHGETSTPELEKVLIEENDEEYYWEGDLNQTIAKIFVDLITREGDEENLKRSASIVSDSSESEKHEGEARQSLKNIIVSITGEGDEENLKRSASIVSDSSESEKHEGEARQSLKNIIVSITREGDEENLKKSASIVSDSSESEKHEGEAKLEEEEEEEKERPLLQDAVSIKDREFCEDIEKPLVQPAALNTTTIHEKNLAGESHDREIPPNENFFTQAKISVSAKSRETIEAQEISETPLVEADQNALSPTSITQDAEESHDREVQNLTGEKSFKQITTSLSADNKKRESLDREISDNFFTHTKSRETIEDQEICETIEKPSTIQGAEESRDREIQIPTGENSFKQTTISTSADNKETNEAQEVCEAKTTVQDAGSANGPTRPDPEEADEASSYTTYKGMFDISLENLPFLEAGLERHPQMLEWLKLKPKPRRVLASSSFSLFAEVTRLLRTTRRCDLSHDDRDYIRQCCTSLQGVGFDASWLSHVDRCIEQCGGARMLKGTLEEAEAKASTLKAQLESFKNDLASLEASLVSLRHKAGLHHFIDS